MRKYAHSIHFAGAAFLTFILLEYDKNPTIWDWGPGGKYKILPALSLVAEVAFFLLAALGDVISFLIGRQSTTITSIRDHLFTTLAFPFAVFVSATFWGIYAVDRELIFPTALDAIIPPWINHGLHTWNAVLILLEGAVVHHKYPVNRAGIFFTLLPAACYLVWITYIAQTQNFWVYPFLRMMENSGRAAFFGLCAIILIIFYFMGKWMTTTIWEAEPVKKSQERKAVTKKKSKKVE
ncbi:androgen-induced gene 1 protein isoform X2 [Nematostella vectensis]|uniref:androgen-induced gene 1 protein isoform X2 n=1 Tax=Nematostella vectensis TaxID=45351 RepID=UPI0013900817|nr:androgen-induced gene 1 protein isoform X2 [Nematostella vectensis]